MADNENLKTLTGILGPADIWRDKDDWAKRELQSREAWSRMNDDDRQAVLDIVQRSLERMLDRLNDWVPSALTVEQGRYLDVTFRILFTELEVELRSKEEITTRQINKAAESTKQLVEELEKK